jgi:dTDP-glucose pyrophosphorylase
MKKNFLIIKDHQRLDKVIRKMDSTKIDFCICLDKFNKILGTLTHGDIAKFIVKNHKTKIEVINSVNKNFVSINSFNKKRIDKIFKKILISKIPIIRKGKILKVVSRDDFYNTNKNQLKNNSVVIMAGGKGVRLDPFTKIMPKALLPINDEPVVLKIVKNFLKYGVNDFFISINHKSQIIKNFFSQEKKNYNLNFIEEKKPMGTAGSLSLINKKITTPFFVINCDVLLDVDLNKVLKWHNLHKSDLTIVAAIKNFAVPYGVLKLNNKFDLNSIDEKPNYNFFVNTGLYLFNAEVLQLIKKNKFLDMNQFIQKLIQKKKKIKIFSVSENNWYDVGNWTEYFRTKKYM